MELGRTPIRRRGLVAPPRARTSSTPSAARMPRVNASLSAFFAQMRGADPSCDKRWPLAQGDAAWCRSAPTPSGRASRPGKTLRGGNRLRERWTRAGPVERDDHVVHQQPRLPPRALQRQVVGAIRAQPRRCTLQQRRARRSSSACSTCRRLFHRVPSFASNTSALAQYPAHRRSARAPGAHPQLGASSTILAERALAARAAAQRRLRRLFDQRTSGPALGALRRLSPPACPSHAAARAPWRAASPAHALAAHRPLGLLHRLGRVAGRQRDGRRGDRARRRPRAGTPALAAVPEAQAARRSSPAPRSRTRCPAPTTAWASRISTRAAPTRQTAAIVSAAPDKLQAQAFGAAAAPARRGGGSEATGWAAWGVRGGRTCAATGTGAGGGTRQGTGGFSAREARRRAALNTAGPPERGRRAQCVSRGAARRGLLAALAHAACSKVRAARARCSRPALAGLLVLDEAKYAATRRRRARRALAALKTVRCHRGDFGRILTPAAAALTEPPTTRRTATAATKTAAAFMECSTSSAPRREALARAKRWRRGRWRPTRRARPRLDTRARRNAGRSRCGSRCTPARGHGVRAAAVVGARVRANMARDSRRRTLRRLARVLALAPPTDGRRGRSMTRRRARCCTLASLVATLLPVLAFFEELAGELRLRRNALRAVARGRRETYAPATAAST